jgi:hypothetical protein
MCVRPNKQTKKKSGFLQLQQSLETDHWRLSNRIPMFVGQLDMSGGSSVNIVACQSYCNTLSRVDTTNKQKSKNLPPIN